MSTVFSSRRAVVVVAIFMASCTVLLLAMQPASGHSDLESSNPVAGSVLEQSPDEIVLTFNQAVSISSSSILVYNEDAKRVSTSHVPKKAGTKKVVMGLEELLNGSYVVSWNVVSVDSHPIRGAFTFSVNAPARNSYTDKPELQKILDGQDIASDVKYASAALRTISFLSTALVIAIIAMSIYILSAQSALHLSRWLYAALIICALSSLGLIVSHAAASQLLSFVEALKPSVITNEMSSDFGHVNLIRIGICACIAVVWRWRSIHTAKIFLVLAAIGLAACPALSGHARAGDWIITAIILSTAHVAASSIWFGGLVIVIRYFSSLSVAQIKKFSNMALACVGVIVATGLFAWWRQIGSIDAMRTTWFGQLTSYKIMLLIAIIVIAFLSRQLTKRIVEHDDIQTRKKLVWLLVAEALIILVIYSVTSVLVNTIPARDSLEIPVTKRATSQLANLEFIADPARAGAGELHVYILTKTGTPMQLERYDRRIDEEIITVTMKNKDKDIGPIVVPMRFQGLNHFSSVGLVIPFEGTWTITARVDLTDFDQAAGSVDIVYK